MVTNTVLQDYNNSPSNKINFYYKTQSLPGLILIWINELH